MQIDIRIRKGNFPVELREHVLRRAHFRLSRFGSEVASVVIRVRDVNGPKGGVDKRCQVLARGPRIGSLVIESLNADTFSAVDDAVERIGRLVGRELEKIRGHVVAVSSVRQKAS